MFTDEGTCQYRREQIRHESPPSSRGAVIRAWPYNRRNLKAMDTHQQSAIESYLRGEFPGAKVRRILRAGDATPEHIRPHAEFGGEIFEVETDDRDFQVGFTDELLEDTQDLPTALKRRGVADRMRVLERHHRVLVLTSGIEVVPIDRPL